MPALPWRTRRLHGGGRGAVRPFAGDRPALVRLLASIARGFCQSCGASLFWRRAGAGRLSLAAGSLDPPTGLLATGHIHLASAGDWYRIADGLPQFAAGDGGTLGSDADG